MRGGMTPRFWAALTLVVLLVAARSSCALAGAVARAARAPRRPARRAAVAAGRRRSPGAGRSTRALRPAPTARWSSAWSSAAAARAHPARRAAGRRGRAPVRRRTGSPAAVLGGLARRARRRAGHAAVRGLAAHRRCAATACPPRAGPAGRSTCSRATRSARCIGGGGAARLLHRHPVRAALVVGVRRGRRGRAGRAVLVRASRCWSSRCSTSSPRWPTARCAPS